jgi:hypothetical protein
MQNRILENRLFKTDGKGKIIAKSNAVTGK